MKTLPYMDWHCGHLGHIMITLLINLFFACVIVVSYEMWLPSTQRLWLKPILVFKSQ